MAFLTGSSKWFGVAAVVAAGLLPVNLTSASDRNSCGCYQTDSGSCICDKKAKCGCPGSCEPQGCEERRDKALQKQIELETRKARDADKQRAAAPDREAPGSAAPAPRAARGLPPAQVKQLAKLLDQYLAANPNARTETVGALRDQILRSP
jgi:hypothetical protein